MTTSVKDLLKQEPAELYNWLKAVREGTNTVTEDVNWWLGIAQSATSKATKETDAKVKLQWAEIALLVYEYLAEDLDRTSRDSFETSAMMFRALMVSQLGINFENPVLNPNLVEDWFFKRLPLSIEEAANKAANWPERPIEEIRQLRRIKNRLLVIKELRKEGYLKDNAELSKWIEISESLP